MLTRINNGLKKKHLASIYTDNSHDVYLPLIFCLVELTHYAQGIVIVVITQLSGPQQVA